MSISGSGSKQVVAATNPKPTIRTLTAKAIPTTTAKTTMTSTKIAKPSTVQTKVNDFFEKPQSSIQNTIQPSAKTNLDPSLRRASPKIIHSPVNANPANEQNFFNSIKQTQSPFLKPQNSPKMLSRRSQLYDFDASFMSTQFSVVNRKQNKSGQYTLKLAHQPENEPRLAQTPMSSRLLNASSNGNEFVSAKSIFIEARKEISLSVDECFDECDDECFETPFSQIQNEHRPPKNIATCIEATGNVLPKQEKCLEKSIADILNCNVNVIDFRRKYRDEFEMKSKNGNKEASQPSTRQPLMCPSNDSNAHRVTAASVEAPAIDKESFCDTFFSSESTEWPFSPIRMKSTRPVDSPMLERKKQKQKANFDFNFNDVDAIEWNNMQKNSSDSIPFSMPISQHRDNLLNCGLLDNALGNPPTQNSSMDRCVAANNATVSNFDEMRLDSRDVEKFWSNTGGDDSPNTSTERKMTIIDQLIANRGARDKSDAKYQMKKPCGKMVQARVKRTNHSSTRSDSLNRSWDPSFTGQNYSKEERNREYIRRNILRLPREKDRHSRRDGADADDAMGFDWFSEWYISRRKAKQLHNSNKYMIILFSFLLTLNKTRIGTQINL